MSFIMDLFNRGYSIIFIIVLLVLPPSLTLDIGKYGHIESQISMLGFVVGITITLFLLKIFSKVRELLYCRLHSVFLTLEFPE